MVIPRMGAECAKSFRQFIFYRYHNCADDDDLCNQQSTADSQSVLPLCDGLVRPHVLLLRLLRSGGVRCCQLLHEEK